MVHRHSICFGYISGQMGMAEPNEKALISGSKTEMSEQSGADWNNRIQIEKGVILLHCVQTVGWATGIRKLCTTPIKHMYMEGGLLWALNKPVRRGGVQCPREPMDSCW
jgi:hypothetical protein